MHVDIHQHVWPGALIEELRRRSQPPRLDGWTLLTAGEPPFVVNPADHDVGRRAALTARDGAGRVVIGLSSPLGIEYLMPEEAEPLLDAYHRGVIELGAPFAGWAAACLGAIDASDLAKQLDRGLVGLQLPATAVADEPGKYKLRVQMLIHEFLQRLDGRHLTFAGLIATQQDQPRSPGTDPGANPSFVNWGRLDARIDRPNLPRRNVSRIEFPDRLRVHDDQFGEARNQFACYGRSQIIG